MVSKTDVIVLGVGTCGEDAALRLLRSGLQVTGIEARLVGGECAYWACLPTKAMIRSANLLQEARRADGLVGRVDVEPDWPTVATRVRTEVTGDWDDSNAVARFENHGGRLIRGFGMLVGLNRVAVDDEIIEADRGIIIATGSEPAVPPIPGMAEVPYWTTHEAISASDLPESILILGGGPVGCELGQVFARFGSKVTVIEGADRLLPGEEPEASAIVMDAFGEEGITVIAGTRVGSVAASVDSITVRLEDGRGVTGNRLLLAAGRHVNLDGLGLESAGIDASGRFIEVDGRLRAAEGVWAIGDVTGKGMLTQVALYQGAIAVADILGAEPSPADYSTLPRATFTDPEVGSVGLSERQARAASMDIDVVVKDVPATFRGWLHRSGNTGVVKLVADGGRDVLVGGTVVGPHGAEVLGMLALAIRTNAPLSQLLDMIYAFPTFYGGVGEALGAYGRGLTRVLDPGSTPMFDDRRQGPDQP